MTYNKKNWVHKLKPGDLITNFTRISIQKYVNGHMGNPVTKPDPSYFEKTKMYPENHIFVFLKAVDPRWSNADFDLICLDSFGGYAIISNEYVIDRFQEFELCL